jgi:hypothetical protein
MTMTMMKFRCAAGAAALLLVAASVCRADPVEDFYRGRTINLYIGFTPGGGYDLYARMLARHLGHHIPGARVLIELPRQPFGDGRAYQDRDAGTPDNALVIWKGMFDTFHDESKRTPQYCPFQFHPYVSGRPGRSRTLQAIIQHMKAAGGVWLATGSEAARWCLDKVFKADMPVAVQA